MLDDPRTHKILPRETKVMSLNRNVCTGRSFFYHFNLLFWFNWINKKLNAGRLSMTSGVCAWARAVLKGLRGEGRAPAEGLSAISSRPYLFFAALFSQYRNASLDITQASWSCAASAESNLAPEQHSCQADKTLTLSFTLKCFLFFSLPNIQNTQGSQIADMCARAWWNPAFFHALLCKIPMLFI